MTEFNEFEKLGLSDNAIYAIKKKGFEEPTDIQKKTIPLLMESDRDIIAQAQTGTGKTAAFALPLIEKLIPNKKYPSAIILTPTRELAIQVAEEINSLKGRKKFVVVPIYGGQSIDQQLSRLKKGVDIVVGTPGRIIDHLKRKTLKLDKVEYFILDEADEMLNMGFIEDIEEILSKTREDKRVLLFSATIPGRIRELAKKYLKNPKTIVVKKEQLTTELTEQIYFEVSSRDRVEALCRIIDIEKEFYGLIFCRTKVGVNELANKLIDRGYDAEALHGDISQYQRERILNKFKKKRINILVATDVAARGLDIGGLTHVINYSLPQNPEAYVHRIGRTGRAGKEGIAITFITPSEYRKLVFIKKIAHTDIKKGKLPKIDDIIKAKQNRVKAVLSDIINRGEHLKYREIAKELEHDNYDTLDIIAALLKYSLKEELERSNYSDINEIKPERRGTARLFIAKGKDNKMTKKKLIDFICDKVDIDERKMRDIRLFDKFSFITVPFEEAELIVDAFKKGGRGRRPVVEKAKDKKPKKRR